MARAILCLIPWLRYCMEWMCIQVRVYMCTSCRSLLPGKFINQFACENVLTCKDLLACVTCRRVNQLGAASSTFDKEGSRGGEEGGGGPTSAPSWLPLTFNLLYELPLFVHHYLERNEKWENESVVKTSHFQRMPYFSKFTTSNYSSPFIKWLIIVSNF